MATEKLHSVLRGCEVVFLVDQQPEGIGEGLEERCGALVGAHHCQRIVGTLDHVPQNIFVDLVLELLRKLLEGTAGAVAAGLS